MGEFKDASVWIQVAFLCSVIGFIVDLFGFAEGLGSGFGGSGAEACLVIGKYCTNHNFLYILFELGDVLILTFVTGSVLQ